MVLKQSYRARKRLFLWDRRRDIENLLLSEFLGQRFSCCFICFFFSRREGRVRDWRK